MKKLIATTMTLAVAFAASADSLAPAMGFESLTAGNGLDISKADDGSVISGGSYWATRDSDPQLNVTAYGQDAKYSYPLDQPALVTGGPGNNYLAIETSDPVYRTLLQNPGTPQGATIGDGIFIDTLVKFTATESLEVPDLAGGRLAIWLGTDADAQVPVTNLYVTAAAINGNSLVATNFLVSSAIDPAAWHRLTVRAIGGIGNITAGPLIGFTVFVDGVQVAAQNADYASLVPSAGLNSVASSFAAENQLFVGCTTGSSLEAVGFKGTGSVDDIAFTDYAAAPSWAQGSASFTLTWDADAIASLTIGETALSAADLALETYDIANANLNPTITVSVTYKAGYFGDASQTFTWSASTPTGTVAANKHNFTVGVNKYTTFAAALAAASANDTIVLADDVTESLTSMYEPSVAITIDVAGHDWTLTIGDAVAFSASANLVVIDSIGGGSITGTGAPIFGAEEAYVVIGAASGDAGITIIGQAFENTFGTSVVKGKFDQANNSKTVDGNPEFKWTTENGSDVTLANSYWLVNMGGSSSGSWADASSAANDATAATVWPALAGSTIATANAKKLADWADAQNVAFGSEILADAFILNCANTAEAVNAAKAAFKVSISFDEGTPVVTVLPANANYNVTPVVQGKAALSGSWADADYTNHKFFRAVLALPAAAVAE